MDHKTLGVLRKSSFRASSRLVKSAPSTVQHRGPSTNRASAKKMEEYYAFIKRSQPKTIGMSPEQYNRYFVRPYEAIKTSLSQIDVRNQFPELPSPFNFFNKNHQKLVAQYIFNLNKQSLHVPKNSSKEDIDYYLHVESAVLWNEISLKLLKPAINDCIDKWRRNPPQNWDIPDKACLAKICNKIVNAINKPIEVYLKKFIITEITE